MSGPRLVLVTGLPGTGKSTMANAAGRSLGAPVLAHDWAMSGLRPFREVQRALDGMGFLGHRAVGWSILWSLARAQLRSGSSVVLDGVAHDPEVAQTLAVADDEGARALVVMTTCADAALHRTRVEGRTRGIPDWYELDWDHVAQARSAWVPPSAVDLSLEAAHSVEDNAATLRERLARWRESA